MNEEKKMIRCPSCGNTVESGSKFCTSCGSTLPQVTAKAPEPAPVKSAAQPQYNYSYPTPFKTERAPQPVKEIKKQNVFLIILSCFLALLLSIVLVAAIPITLLRSLLTDRNIDIIVDRVIESVELDKLEFATADGTKPLSGVLLDITDEFEGWDHITEEQINDALLEDFVKQFVTDALKQYGMSLKEGEQMLGWTPEQIYDFVEANRETIEELAREAGYTGKLPIEEKKEMMIANIEQRIGKDGISVNTLLEGSGEAEAVSDFLNTAQLIFSNSTLWLAWGIVALLAIILFFINLGYFGSFLRSCGFPAFIVGATFFISAFSVDPIMALIEFPNEMIAGIVSFVVKFLVAMLMDISLTVLVVGLLLIIASFIADAIKKRV